MSFVNMDVSILLKMSMHCFIIKLRFLGITINCLDIISVEIKNESKESRAKLPYNIELIARAIALPSCNFIDLRCGS